MGARLAATLAVIVAGCGFSIRGTDGELPIDAAAVDARPIDATVSDVADVCPVAYAALGTSRYLLLVNPGPFGAHQATCASHAPGATHLAVIDDRQEAVDLVAAARLVANVQPNARFYVGAIQAPDRDDPDEGWIDFADRPIAETLWAGTEPNDGPDDNETNHQEQVGALQLDREYLVDLAATENVRAICECDGAAVGPIATSYLPSI